MDSIEMAAEIDRQIAKEQISERDGYCDCCGAWRELYSTAVRPQASEVRCSRCRDYIPAEMKLSIYRYRAFRMPG